ncbi:uncharacterized protein TOT_010000243 [Theileria orientalis strain Shintoku]|uniref:MATH domain-containing protein n=1 Tax=Theileria orientalis strain Shintoku TaxID=869250 RepID=J7M4M1_THEOR|nr:uncharacterized protein TOT_010000243 [Theileria orientalis strain Shintoku]BAM38775.1 uncharacterized protein TOT_010000243 [Theileria orientalis strain Shintoku]|eukprot:XP_009689076.1 uncharacterized protein TOT_010000243 [Theileria orientalis strain Shintoku]
MSSSEKDNLKMTQSNTQERSEEQPSDSSHKECLIQDCYFQDDTHFPCYMCSSQGGDAKSTTSDDGCAGVEFAIRSFWRIAKTQNDIESPMEGNSKGFHYRLLLHPRGTAGTDSESSHLSVFVEAVVQDWYPEYWVFPNVRFELTVVNFKDPKQSVTSWAHWSFSSDATSRGWQKMISHARLTKTAGFMDEEGTVLIRGKAEPPYGCLWSKAPLYQPQMMWEYIPDRAQRELCTEVCSKMIHQANESLNRTNQSDAEDENITDCMLLKCLDSVVPAISPTLDSDILSLMVHVLYHLREFRRSVLLWNYEFDGEVTEETSIIVALQKVFAYMYLYPLAVSCRTYKISSVDNSKISKYYLYELIPKQSQKNRPQYISESSSGNRDNSSEATEEMASEEFQVVNDKYDAPTVNCCSFDGGRYEWEVRKTKREEKNKEKEDQGKQSPVEEYRLMPGTLSNSIGERPDVFSKLLPPSPNLKPILKAMHMTDLQTLEPQDLLVNLHSEMFTMILRDLASAKKLLKQRRMKTAQENGENTEGAERKEGNEEETLPVYLRDQTLLESTCKFLFSGSPENETLFSHPSVDDISTIYIRCKHSNSLQKALEATPKTLARYPQVLFFYLYPTKNAKKGELFDVPLRLDCTSIKVSGGFDNMSDDSRNTNNYDEYGNAECSEDDEDAFGDYDNACDKEHNSVKWYSLYALIIKEGDMRYDASGKGTSFNTLLLRPEEDGPWYRMSEGKVEKLTTKMEFTEWKCHRDFFCVSAVYIAEDYIDMLQVGEVDLIGNLKDWNPKLYYATLAELGVTEQDLLAAVEYRMNMPKSGASEEEQEEYASLKNQEDMNKELYEEYTKHLLGDVAREGNEEERDREGRRADSIYDYLHLRKIGRGNPKLSACCDVHGYDLEVLASLDEKERRYKYEVSASKREIMRRVNRLKTVAPLVSWLLNASKENSAMLHAVNPTAEGSLLVDFLQRRERIFEEEFRQMISELFFRELCENVANNGVYTWEGEGCSCGCSCKMCKNRPALFLTENGRFPGEEVRTQLLEPATILFRNIQILRCHLEYFCRDCWNLRAQLREKGHIKEPFSIKEMEVKPIKHLLEGSGTSLPYPQLLPNPKSQGDARYGQQTPEELISRRFIKYEMESSQALQNLLNTPKLELGQKSSEVTEFLSTSERSSIFLVECIWDACVRYTMDCRTMLLLKACTDENTVKFNLPAAVKSLQEQIQQTKTLYPIEGRNNALDLPDQEGMIHFEAKYDLTVEQELEIMRIYSKKYDLPAVSEMRNYLRRKRVLVYPLIRPHELLRAYMLHKHGVNVREELEKMGHKILWNERSFNQKVLLSDLKQSELRILGLKEQLPDGYEEIGANLCRTYEKLLTKMLVHMQDANKNEYQNCFDYVYTVGDLGKIVESIEMDCDMTLNMIKAKQKEMEAAGEGTNKTPEESACANSCGSLGKNIHLCTHESCVCMGHECKYNFGYNGYILPFWVSNEMADLTVFTNSQLQAYNESLIEDLSEMCLKSDDKKKKKVKTGKQSLEKGTCIIPPLDVKLKSISFDQERAHRSDPQVFLSPDSVARFYCKKESAQAGHKFKQTNTGPNPHNHTLNMSICYLPLLNLTARRAKDAPSSAPNKLEAGKTLAGGTTATGTTLAGTTLPSGKTATGTTTTGTTATTGPGTVADDADFRPTMLINCKFEGTDGECYKVKNSLEIGILTTHDLFGLEGFSCETKVMPTKKLHVNHKYHGAATKVAHLYWAIRKLLSAQISEEFMTLGASKTKKKTKCLCGNECPDENECTVKLSWRPCAGDCFMLYALKNDVHALRMGKKFVYMQPNMDLSYYVTTEKSRAPDITVLICGGPSSFYINGPNTWFPLQDDAEYPLLIFKWMCVDSVDLLCLGAVVCDAKKQLQQYIFEWLLPIIRELGYLSSLEGKEPEQEGQSKETSKDEDVDKYQVLEECHIRSVQNVRRWSCAIKKINKKSGDVIITQLKRTIDSPATIRFKESVSFMNSVKELTELEALELLPDSNNFYSDTWANPQQDEPDMGSKLSKKKKRKSTKSAIPSNKKSTFSRRVQPTEDDEEEEQELQSQEQRQNDDKAAEAVEHGGKKDEEEPMEKATKTTKTLKEVEGGLPAREEYEERDQKMSAMSDFEGKFEAFENFERQFENEYEGDFMEEDSLGRLNLTEKQSLLDPAPASASDRLEASAKSTTQGPGQNITTLVKEGECRMVLDLCPTLGLARVCEEVYELFEAEFKSDFIQRNKLEYAQMATQSGLQLGKNLKNLLKVVKMMFTRISGPEPVRQMVKKLYENYALKASFTLSYLLPYYNPTIQLMDDVLEYVLEDLKKYSHFLFSYNNEYIKMLLQQMVLSICKNEKIKAKLDASVLFLMNTVVTPRMYAHAYAQSYQKVQPLSNYQKIQPLSPFQKMHPLGPYQKLQAGFASPKKSLDSEDSPRNEDLDSNDPDSGNELGDGDQMSTPSKGSRHRQHRAGAYDLENGYHTDGYKHAEESYEKKLELEKMMGQRSVRETLLHDLDDELVGRPLLHWLEAENEQFEKLFLQQLKTWWSARHSVMDKIRASIHPSNDRDSIHINLVSSGSGARDHRGRDDLSLDVFDLRILLQFAESCPDVSLCFNRDSITLYFHGKIDRRQFVRSIKEARRFFGSNSTTRSVPNLPIEHTDTPVASASLMDMQLNTSQTALLLLSLKYSSFSQQVDSQFLESICKYKTHKLINIPPPPRSSASMQESV